MSSTKNTYITVREEYLRKVFAEVKSDDLTRSQFEAEKTKRIAALAGALGSIEFSQGASDLVKRLNDVMDEEYRVKRCLC